VTPSSNNANFFVVEAGTANQYSEFFDFVVVSKNSVLFGPAVAPGNSANDVLEDLLDGTIHTPGKIDFNNSRVLIRPFAIADRHCFNPGMDWHGNNFGS